MTLEARTDPLFTLAEELLAVLHFHLVPFREEILL
jgi:hypothetical protein